MESGLARSVEYETGKEKRLDRTWMLRLRTEGFDAQARVEQVHEDLPFSRS